MISDNIVYDQIGLPDFSFRWFCNPGFNIFLFNLILMPVDCSVLVFGQNRLLVLVFGQDKKQNISERNDFFYSLI